MLSIQYLLYMLCMLYMLYTLYVLYTYMLYVMMYLIGFEYLRWGLIWTNKKEENERHRLPNSTINYLYLTQPLLLVWRVRNADRIYHSVTQCRRHFHPSASTICLLPNPLIRHSIFQPSASMASLGIRSFISASKVCTCRFKETYMRGHGANVM